MLVSTFELLVKPQFPNPKFNNPPIPQIPPLLSEIDQISRTVVQGYFLTIANVEIFDVTLSLVFTASNPMPLGLNFNNVLNILDASGTNLVGKLVPEVGSGNKKARFTFTIPGNDTGLFILQPDFINNPKLLEKADFELRGYVEIFVSSLSGSASATLLLSAEQRGTFFKVIQPSVIAGAEPQIPPVTPEPPIPTPIPIPIPVPPIPVFDKLDQIAYSIPVNGGPLVKLSNS